ncbi:hypothetical protein HALDL1_03115 [Halobacterium sp. DL1]|jgi:hypothetical protein|nr:hypothetical protein HALDL1_03115 [Halobacterium sp. DL1]
MRRRQFLASAAGLSSAALAGCTSAGNSATPTTERSTTEPSTTTDESTTQTTTTTSVPAVGDVWVGRSFTYLYAGSHFNAYTVTGSGPLFVFALVADEHHQGLALDGQSHYPASDVAGSVGADAVFSQRDTDERSIVTYALPDPVNAASGAVGDVELDASQLDFLADPAEFAVTDASVPDTVQKGSEAAVTVTAENSGGTTGTFRAAATSQSTSGYDVGAVDVAPGERGTVEVRVPIYGENEERVTADWGSGSEELAVGVES